MVCRQLCKDPGVEMIYLSCGVHFILVVIDPVYEHPIVDYCKYQQDNQCKTRLVQPVEMSIRCLCFIILVKRVTVVPQ